MKKRSIGMIVTTLAVVAAGSVILAISSANAKEQVKTNLSGEIELDTDFESANVLREVESATKEEKEEREDKVNKVEWNDPKIELFNNFGAYDPLHGTKKVVAIGKNYKKQVVLLEDALVDKETAESNALKIMDYIFDTVDEDILKQNGIDLSAYEKEKRYLFHIQRQYQYQDKVNYGVFVKKEGDIIWSVGISLEEEPKVVTFAMDGLIDLYGAKDNPIPKEYLTENWCKTSEQKEAIYNDYFETSREFIEETLGLAAIRTDVKDLECASYFDADNDWSTVCFGYVLEDGLYVKVFYNRVNQKWDGFVIAGYYRD